MEVRHFAHTARGEVIASCSTLALRIMYALAMQAGLPMKTLPTTRDFQLPDDLHPILAQLLSYAQSNGALDLNPDKDRLLRQRYLHHSANWNVSDDGTYPLAILYVNRPTGDGKRVVLPNETNP